MAKMTVQLTTGIEIANKVHDVAEIREPTAGEVLSASERAEKLYSFLNAKGQFDVSIEVSPTLLSKYLLCNQIVSIGELKGPIDLDVLNKLSSNDFALLQQAAQELDIASQAVTQRGRNDAPSKGA